MSQIADTQTRTSQGVLELHPKGFGFLRCAGKFYAPQPQDAYVSHELIRQFHLREGMLLEGPTEPAIKGTSPRLGTVERIEGQDPALIRQPDWSELTPIDPRERIRLEMDSTFPTTRVMDLFTPIGKGQRGLIVAPPRTGKTVLLQHIAQAVSKNHPEMHLMVLLIDERPEEVTEMRRTVRGEVLASSSDKDALNHTRLAQLVIERAKRLTEQGKDVFVLLDSLTRLARAYNKTTGNGGRTMSGGLDSRALDVPKRLFGSARAIEEGGSLTVIGTALVETGSKMDDVIFEEFKGTGNMELVLDRKLSDRRIFPAINLAESGTRKEERLIPEDDLKRIHLLRRHMIDLPAAQAMDSLLKQMTKSTTNKAFLDRMKVTA